MTRRSMMSSIFSTKLTALLLLFLFCFMNAKTASCAFAADCYQYGGGGWDLVWWGENPRLPEGGPGIPICITVGYVNFKWRKEAGVFQIPSAHCPSSFESPYNETFKELAPVSGQGVYIYNPPAVVGSYFITSQVPGACEAGTFVRVDVIGQRSSATQRAGQLLGATLAALAAVAGIMLL